MRILLDMDEVIVDLMPHWLGFLNDKFDRQVQVEDVTHWDLHRFYPGIEPREIYRALKRPGFFRYLPDRENAIGAIYSWIKTYGHSVGIVTACVSGHSDKREWLDERMPFFNPENLIFATKKHWVVGDVFVDDRPENLTAYRATHPAATVICMDRPWNRGEWDGCRVADWAQLYQVVCDLSFQAAVGAD